MRHSTRLLDQFEHPSAAASEIWYDEWICPYCRGGICPEGELADLEAEAPASVEADDVTSLEDLRLEHLAPATDLVARSGFDFLDSKLGL